MIKKELLSNKKVIVFDLDGTVVRLTVDWDSLKRLLSEKYTEIYAEHCSFSSISECLSTIIDKNDKVTLENFFKIILQYELENIQKTQPIKEIVFFIENLDLFGIQNSSKLAILSLNMRETIRKALKQANIEGAFDFILGREDVMNWKPNPEGLLKIKYHFNVKKEDIIFFGDKKKDLQTGLNSGIDAFWIDDLLKLVTKVEKEKKRHNIT
ncbi:MAG: HAD family hydrolase [Promethearchaeota archaeon]|jgi:phosphoglycolate phosphatase